jgi:hypothetical protein
MENKKECTVTILVALSAPKKEDDISSNQFHCHKVHEENVVDLVAEVKSHKNSNNDEILCVEM